MFAREMGISRGIARCREGDKESLLANLENVESAETAKIYPFLFLVNPKDW